MMESDEEVNDAEESVQDLATQPHHSNMAHHHLEHAFNQHQSTMMNNSMDSGVGGGC